MMPSHVRMRPIHANIRLVSGMEGLFIMADAGNGNGDPRITGANIPPRRTEPRMGQPRPPQMRPMTPPARNVNAPDAGNANMRPQPMPPQGAPRPVHGAPGQMPQQPHGMGQTMRPPMGTGTPMRTPQGARSGTRMPASNQPQPVQGTPVGGNAPVVGNSGSGNDGRPASRQYGSHPVPPIHPRLQPQQPTRNDGRPRHDEGDAGNGYNERRPLAGSPTPVGGNGSQPASEDGTPHGDSADNGRHDTGEGRRESGMRNGLPSRPSVKPVMERPSLKPFTERKPMPDMPERVDGDADDASIADIDGNGGRHDAFGNGGGRQADGNTVRGHADGTGDERGRREQSASKGKSDGRRRFSSKADDESRYAHDAEGNRLNGPGTGRRAGDRSKRNSRASVNAMISDSQAKEIDRMNMRARKRDARAKAFQMTRRDQQVFDYLVRWRFATIRDVSRIAGWSESYMKTNRRFNAYIDLGLVYSERVPLESYRYVQATPLGARLSRYAFLGTDNDKDVLRSHRGHAFGLSSLASHLMNARKDADDEERDLLGVGEDEWKRIRHEILDGESQVIAEREYRSAWSRIRSTAAGRSPSALTERRYRHAMEEIFRRAHQDPNDLHSPMARDTMELFSTNPEYQGENAWLWVIYGNEMIQRDGNGGLRRLSVDGGQVMFDDKGRPVVNPQRGDLFSTQDHCPDLVIARPRDKETGRPNSIAVELELTPKDMDDYIQTMCGYTSANGRLLYKTVVWQVVNAALGNVIRKASVKAGAVEGRDFIIAPVYSADMKSSYNRGADMQPGRWRDPDRPHGYTVAKSAAEEAGYADLNDILNGQ